MYPDRHIIIEGGLTHTVDIDAVFATSSIAGAYCCIIGGYSDRLASIESCKIPIGRLCRRKLNNFGYTELASKP